VILNVADIFDVVSGKSKKPVLPKLSTETEDDARKRYGVDYLILKKRTIRLRSTVVTR